MSAFDPKRTSDVQNKRKLMYSTKGNGQRANLTTTCHLVQLASENNHQKTNDGPMRAACALICDSLE
jgi:hypothetical protein